jgi:hypothetical protein
MLYKKTTLVLGLALTFFVLPGCNNPPAEVKIEKPQETLAVNQNLNQNSNPDQGGVALPSDISIIHTFFELMNEQRAADAVSMMTPTALGDESQKQAWGLQFNAFQQISAEKIDPSMKEEWTETQHSYKVTLNVQLKPEAAKALIPNYGFENGTNIRWVTLEKIDNLWKVGGIGTGP